MLELELLIGLFPHLRDSYDSEALPLKFIMQRNSGALAKKKGDRKPAGG